MFLFLCLCLFFQIPFWFAVYCKSTNLTEIIIFRNYTGSNQLSGSKHFCRSQNRYWTSIGVVWKTTILEWNSKDQRALTSVQVIQLASESFRLHFTLGEGIFHQTDKIITSQSFHELYQENHQSCKEGHDFFYSSTNCFKLETSKIILLFLKHFPGCGTHAIAERYKNAAMTDKCLLVNMCKVMRSCHHHQEI